MKDEPVPARLDHAQRDQAERVVQQMRDDIGEQRHRPTRGGAGRPWRYFRSGSTAPGGRPMAARLPATTIGRCSRTGWAAIAFTMSALAEIGLLLPERLELGLAVADQRAQLAAHHVQELLDLGLAGRLLEVLADRRRRHLSSSGGSKRLARLAAARVVPDRDGHPCVIWGFFWGRSFLWRTRATHLFVQCIGQASGSAASITFLSNLVGEAGARHGGEVAEAPVRLAVLPAGMVEPAPSRQARRPPAISRWAGLVSSSWSSAAIALSSVSPSTPACLQLLARQAGSTCRAGAARAPWSGRTPCR